MVTRSKLAGICLLLTLFLTNVSVFAKQANILFIMTDDHAAHAIGAYGGRLAELNPTPTLDALAAQGTKFTNVFTTNSICTPSRASILTGQYSQTNGVLDLWGELPEQKQSLPKAMKNVGYETAVIGKWHLKQEPAAFDYYKVLNSQGTYFDPEFRIRGEKKWPDNTLSYRGHSSDVIANQGIEWLRARKNGDPFFLMLQFKAPHDMFEYAPRYEYYLADTDIPEPKDLYKRGKRFGSTATRGENDSLVATIGTSVSKRNFRRNMGQHMGVDPSLSDQAYTHEAYQRYLKAFLRCVKGVDDNIARVIDELKRSGEWENTIIVYTADQGFMLGEHDFIDKRWMYDESMRMPFIVRHPHKPKAPQTNALVINNTDFAPTLIELANGQVPNDMQGQSFASVFDNQSPEQWRNTTYYRYWMHRAHHDVPAHFGVRSARYKLIFYYGAHYKENIDYYYDQAHLAAGGDNRAAVNTPPAWEFYDLKEDPHELKNRYTSKKYAKIIAELKNELKQQRLDLNETDTAYPHLENIISQHWND